MSKLLAVVVPTRDLAIACLGAAIGFALTLWLFADDQEQPGIGLAALAGAIGGALLCLAPVTLVMRLDLADLPTVPIDPVDSPAPAPQEPSPASADGEPATSEQEASVA